MNNSGEHLSSTAMIAIMHNVAGATRGEEAQKGGKRIAKGKLGKMCI